VRRVALLVLACSAAALGCVQSASADSLVFIREHNVWLANGDGTGQYQVTFDGSASSPYESPSQSDGGTIVAVRQPPGHRNQLFRMTQSGALLNPPIDTPAPGPKGADEPKISPDGSLVAYSFVTGVNPEPLGCPFCIEAVQGVLLSHSGSFTAPSELGQPHTGVEPSWISPSTLLLSEHNGTQWYYPLGAPEAAQWFYAQEAGFPEEFEKESFPSLSDGEVAPTGDRMAILFRQSQTLWLVKLNGPPPALPGPATPCFGGPKGKFVDPTWSSDGGTVYWSEEDGVWDAQIAGPTTCNAEPVLLIPGGSEPDASPAPNSPGARPGCGNPGDPMPCPAPAPGPTGPPAPCGTCAGPTPAAISSALGALAKAGVKGFAKLRLRGLRSGHKLTLAFSAPGPGTLTASLTPAGKPRQLLAKGRSVFPAAGRGTLALALTSLGRKRVRGAHSLRATLLLTFVPTGAVHGTSLSTNVTLR
jgi:hypothetical protein